jgi:hypothetical protein
MMRFNKKSLLALAILVSFLVLPTQATAQFTADFSRYVAVGDSLTFAVVSGSLSRVGQDVSYPLQLAEVFGVASGFEQPLVSDPGLPGRLVLTSLVPLGFGQLAGLGTPLNLGLERPYNNLGVPGSEVNETIFKVGGDLPHDLVLRGVGSALEQAIFLQPTFTTVWLGNNDALEAATSGIVIEGETLTSAADFANDYFTVVGALATTGTNMALATIPPVTSIPFVNTVAPVVVDPATQEPVMIGGQVVPLIGPDGLLSLDDKVLLTAVPELAAGRGIPVILGGSGVPLGDEHVLNVSEQTRIQDRIDEFNQTITAAAASNFAALVDIATIFGDAVDNGILIGGIEYDTSLFGGLFSYDGVHASAMGYGVVTNAFIDAINSRFDNNLPSVDLSRFAFGPEGDMGPRGQPVAAVATTQLMRNLREVLDLPNTKKLKRMKRKAERQANRADAGATSGRTRVERADRLERKRQRQERRAARLAG